MNQFTCQFRCVPDLTHEPTSRVIRIEKMRALALRLKRTLNSLKNDLTAKKQVPNLKGAWKSSQRSIIRAGDQVKVLSQEDIRNLVDYRGIYKGCPFLEEQYAYCGNTYEVLKEVDYFYDERKDKLCKCKDIVVIEGTFCSGRQKLYSEACDLNCYFFWHKDWLEKVE